MKQADLEQVIMTRSGLKETDLADIRLAMGLALESIDSMAQWHFAMPVFTATFAAGEKSQSVLDKPLFRPVSCTILVGTGTEYPLTFRQLTDFDEADANYGRTTTNSAPTYYTVAGDEVLIGPGVLSDSAVINGRYQRRLEFSDVDMLPGSLIVEGVLRILSAAGSPEQIKAWALYKEEKANTLLNNKPSNEIRDKRPMDSQIYKNNIYLKSLD